MILESTEAQIKHESPNIANAVLGAVPVHKFPYDWNLKDVRDGTYRSFKKLNLKIIYDREVRLTWDDEHTYKMFENLGYEKFGKNLGYNTWHNGIYVAVLQK